MAANKSAEPHVAMRTCIATGVQKPKNELIRIVRLEDPTDPKKYVVQVDPKGKLRGRGANIDTTEEAFNQAIRIKAISRALKLERQLTEDEVNQLREDFLKAIEEKQFRQGQKRVVLKVSKEELEEKLAK